MTRYVGCVCIILFSFFFFHKTIYSGVLFLWSFSSLYGVSLALSLCVCFSLSCSNVLTSELKVLTLCVYFFFCSTKKVLLLLHSRSVDSSLFFSFSFFFHSISFSRSSLFKQKCVCWKVHVL